MVAKPATVHECKRDRVQKTKQGESQAQRRLTDTGYCTLILSALCSENMATYSVRSVDKRPKQGQILCDAKRGSTGRERNFKLSGTRELRARGGSRSQRAERATYMQLGCAPCSFCCARVPPGHTEREYLQWGMVTCLCTAQSGSRERCSSLLRHYGVVGCAPAWGNEA